MVRPGGAAPGNPRATGGGQRQAGPEVDSATRTARADWRPSLTVDTEGWPEGAYLLRLDGDHGHQRFVPLVVRSADGAGRTVLIHAAATWQAYNLRGGYNLYEGDDGSYETRSLKVSFDRFDHLVGVEYDRGIPEQPTPGRWRSSPTHR